VVSDEAEHRSRNHERRQHDIEAGPACCGSVELVQLYESHGGRILTETAQ
jgi:hypothetical protein